MSFSISISDALFANSNDNAETENFKKLQSRFAEKQLAWQNDESPLAEAQKLADLRMASMQRQPMVFEHQPSPGHWSVNTLYINPTRLSFQTQKLKSKAITRGGIYFHHAGDDVTTLTLSGTAGFAGMKMIEALERSYYASGTLLRYKNFGPQKIDITAGAYGVIDYKDTVGVLNTMVSTNNPTTLGAIQAQYMEKNGDKKTLLTNLVNYTNKVMNSYRTSVSGSKLVDELGAASYKVGDWVVKFKKENGREPTPIEYYNNAVSILKNNMKTPVASDIIVVQAYRQTIKYFTADKISYDDIFKLSYDLSFNGTQYRGFNTSDKLTSFVEEQIKPPSLDWGQQLNTLQSLLESQAATRGSLNGLIDQSMKNSGTDDDPQSLLLKIQAERAEALREHLNQIANWEQRERTIQNQLRTAALTTLGDMFDDEWAPRRLILYYENRAYIGHFDSFSYNRVADSPLIQYDMRFTVEKQILGTLY